MLKKKPCYSLESLETAFTALHTEQGIFGPVVSTGTTGIGPVVFLKKKEYQWFLGPVVFFRPKAEKPVFFGRRPKKGVGGVALARRRRKF